MSRSKRKTPIIGHSDDRSEKDFKKSANRKLRKANKVKLKKGKDVLTQLREVSDVWAGIKDGKRFLKEPSSKDLRK